MKALIALFMLLWCIFGTPIESLGSFLDKFEKPSVVVFVVGNEPPHQDSKGRSKK